jgi:Bacterial inner membrane protein
MDNKMINWIGWVATGVFAVSYFCRQPRMLRIVQAIAALMWVTYGFLISAMPVVVANVIVALAAVYSSFAPVRHSPTT